MGKSDRRETLDDAGMRGVCRGPSGRRSLSQRDRSRAVVAEQRDGLGSSRGWSRTPPSEGPERRPRGWACGGG